MRNTYRRLWRYNVSEIKKRRKIFLWLAVPFLIWAVIRGYAFAWSGFGDYTDPNGGFVRGRTLWDWMELLIIPAVLAGGAIILNRSERKTEREIATDRQHEAVLQAYFDRMSELLLKEKLRTTKKAEVRDLAKTRTLSVMRVMDINRNALIVRFLSEAKLISDTNSLFKNATMDGMTLQGIKFSDVNLTSVYLNEANLEGASFLRANLEGAMLWSVNLRDARLTCANLKGARLPFSNLEDARLDEANLEGAILGGSNLTGADLRTANLTGADLRTANLTGADLRTANLTGANLRSTNLKGADLEGANLEFANLAGAINVTKKQLTSVESLQGAIMPDGTKHE